jgi:hypothetical protein
MGQRTLQDHFGPVQVKYDCKGDLCQAFLYSTSSEALKES